MLRCRCKRAEAGTQDDGSLGLKDEMRILSTVNGTKLMLFNVFMGRGRDQGVFVVQVLSPERRGPGDHQTTPSVFKSSSCGSATICGSRSPP